MANVKLPRILLGDDHRLVAEAFKHMLSSEFDVIGLVADGRTLVQAARRLRPDAVITDIAMPGLNGMDAGRRIKSTLPDTKVIYLTMNLDSDLIVEARSQGASGFISKSCSRRELLDQVHRALANDSADQTAPAPNEPSFPSDPVPIGDGDVPTNRREINLSKDVVLTDRQKDVLQLLAEGLSMKQVGSALNIATRTVAFHKYKIMAALHLENDAELVQFAIRNHLMFVEDAQYSLAFRPNSKLLQFESSKDKLSQRMRRVA